MARALPLRTSSYQPLFSEESILLDFTKAKNRNEPEIAEPPRSTKISSLIYSSYTTERSNRPQSRVFLYSVNEIINPMDTELLVELITVRLSLKSEK